jgi:hypothetical protein
MPHEYNQEAMDIISQWHRRIGHCCLEAIATMVKEPVTGPDPIPANMPSMEELDPYRKRLGCSSCQWVYGSVGGIDSGKRVLSGT